MKQTAGKVFARDYFYRNYLSSLFGLRQLRSSNVLTLLGEDFRELSLLTELGVPSYRVFSVENDHMIYRKQQARNRSDDHGVALYHGGLSDYIHTHLRHNDITVFNLDICGSYLKAVDPVLGELLLHVRRNPQTVVATYSSAGRDRPQLMEGLKSLFILTWLAPEVTDKLVRSIYGQYRSAELAESERNRDEVSKNMLLRHLFWLRSHMEHIMIGSVTVGVSSPEAVRELMQEMDMRWRRFVTGSSFPLRYRDVMDAVDSLERPRCSGVMMDLEFSEVEFLTYSANDGFYHNCYFASFESIGRAVPLEAWLVESAKSLRQNPITLIDAWGQRYGSTYGRIAVDTDGAVMWAKDDVSPVLRSIAFLPHGNCDTVKVVLPDETTDFDALTIGKIHELARQYPKMTAREISERLSLKLPLQRIIAQVAVARRKL